LYTRWNKLVAITLRPFNTLGKSQRAPGIHWVGEWVGPSTGLKFVARENYLLLPGIELQSSGIHTVASPSYCCSTLQWEEQLRITAEEGNRN